MICTHKSRTGELSCTRPHQNIGGISISRIIYISSDRKEPYESHNWNREVTDRIREWSADSRYEADLICADEVYRSVIKNVNGRRCDIKRKCEDMIGKSDIVIFVVGDKTATDNAGRCNGRSCSPVYNSSEKKFCTNSSARSPFPAWKAMSYPEFEINAAVRNKLPIILVYNSESKQEGWIPAWYIKLCQVGQVNEIARLPFWRDSEHTEDRYQDIKAILLKY